MDILGDIRRVMLAKGIAQAELARTLGMSPSQLSQILRDPDYNYSIKMLRRFAAALDTDLVVSLGEVVTVAEEVEAAPSVSGGSWVIAPLPTTTTSAHIYSEEGGTYTIPLENFTLSTAKAEDEITFTWTDSGVFRVDMDEEVESSASDD